MHLSTPFEGAPNAPVYPNCRSAPKTMSSPQIHQKRSNHMHINYLQEHKKMPISFIPLAKIELED
jgi:hypothetical protein